MMNKVELKEQLVKRIEKVKDKIRSYEDMSQPVTPDVSIGRLSRMDAINNKSVVESALRKAKEQLDMLEYALENIDKEEFGKCQKCGQEIPPGRILIAPESAFCVRCAQ